MQETMRVLQLVLVSCYVLISVNAKVDDDEILKACEALAKHHRLKVYARDVAESSYKTAMTTFAGILIGVHFRGPPGLLWGGTIGAFLGYLISEEFKPLHEVIQELPKEERGRLASHMNIILTEYAIVSVEKLQDIVIKSGTIEHEGLQKHLKGHFEK